MFMASACKGVVAMPLRVTYLLMLGENDGVRLDSMSGEIVVEACNCVLSVQLNVHV